jgi:iron(III) transport system substrate-binding protein
MLIRPTRRSVLAGMASSFALPAFAQSPSGSAVIYTSNSEQAVTAVQDTGRKLLPNVKLSTITGGSGQLLRRLEAEAAKPQGDVFWSSSANTLGAFKQLFEPWKAPDLNAILPSLRDPDNLWTAANIHVVVAMINKNQLGGVPMPKTWTDLLDPRFKGKIIIADPANSSTAYTILWGVEKMLGTDALKKLAQNTKVSSAAAAVLRSVGQGEYAIGLTFEANAYAYVAGGQKEISLLYPEDGTFTTAEYLTLIKNAPAGPIAKNVCELLISKECQIALLENAYRRPSRTDIDVSKYVDLPDLAKIKIFATNEDEAAAKRADFLARWQAMVAAAN